MNFELKYCNVTNVNDFIGNPEAIESLRLWLNENKQNVNYKKRFCFLSGATGCGKTTLSKLLIKEAGYEVTEFLASDMRMKQGRHRLLQFLSFRDIMAMIRKKHNKQTKPFKKIALIECIENMGQSAQELYKSIRTLMKKNISRGVPILFTTTLPFCGKKPLNQYSTFIHMRPRTEKQVHKVLIQILKKLENDCSFAKQLISLKPEQDKLTKKAGGDARRLIKYLEFMFNSGSINTNMSEHEIQGVIAGLIRIIHTPKRNIYQISHDIDLGGLRIPFGIHGMYLLYSFWKAKTQKLKPAEKKQICSHFIRDISGYLADFAELQGFSVIHQKPLLEEDAMLVGTIGPRIAVLNTSFTKKKHKRGNYRIKEWKKKKIDNWWLKLEKGEICGDEKVSVPCMTKTLRGYANKHNHLNHSFEQISKGFNSKAWMPFNNKYTVQIMRKKIGKLAERNRVLKIGILNMKKK